MADKSDNDDCLPSERNRKKRSTYLITLNAIQ